MRSFNRVILIGNLTRDVEKLRFTQNGTAVTEIALAVNDGYKSKTGEWVDEVTYVDVTLWARTAEVAAEYLEKGRPVMIEGRLKLDTWEKDGQKHSKLRVVGEKLIMLGGPQGGGDRPPREFDDSEHRPTANVGAPAEQGGGPPPSDDIPF